MTADPASRLPEPPTGRTDWRLARALSEPTLRHDRALATISDAFGGGCATGLLERIDDAARPMFGVAGQSLFNRGNELIFPKRLGQKIHGARLHRPASHRAIALRGDEDDGDGNLRFGQFILKIEPAHLR